MENGYFINGISTGNLLRLVFKHGISCNPKCIGRFLFYLYCSLITSSFSIIERIRYKKILKSMKCPKDPIFIVGHWRSGTTFLHQLMNQSPELTSPSLFQVATPDCFLTGKKFLVPHIRPFLSKKRSVDNVRIGLDEPQEDEYALFRMTTLSPVERLIFPKKSAFFLHKCDSYLPSKYKKSIWRDALQTFCKKLYLKSRKRIVLKNPFHSMRIHYLRNIFPNAKFVHIYRNPLKVIPSSLRMWDIVGKQNALIDKSPSPSMIQIVETYDKMLSKIQNDFSYMKNTHYIEIAYEELESKPIETVKEICKRMNVAFTKTYENNINHFLNKIGPFKKNRYTLTFRQKKYIQDKLVHHMEKYGYRPV